MNHISVVAGVVNFLAGVLIALSWESHYQLTAAIIYCIGGFLIYQLGRADGAIAVRDFLKHEFQKAFDDQLTEHLNETEKDN